MMRLREAPAIFGIGGTLRPRGSGVRQPLCLGQERTRERNEKKSGKHCGGPLHARLLVRGICLRVPARAAQKRGCELFCKVPDPFFDESGRSESPNSVSESNC